MKLLSIIIAVVVPGTAVAQSVPPVAPVAAALPVAAPASEKLVCKRFVETGSLVRARRECRTRAWWSRIAEAAQSNTGDMIERNAGRPSGQ